MAGGAGFARGGYAGLGGRGAYADGSLICRGVWGQDDERMMGDRERMMMERFC